MKCDCHERDARRQRNIIRPDPYPTNESSISRSVKQLLAINPGVLKQSAYQLDEMVSGEWKRFRIYQHTISGMDEAFRRVDVFTSDQVSSRVIDTETGETIMEVNL